MAAVTLSWLGPALRRLSGKNIYLTFDDGPDPILTGAVLDLLKHAEAKATFFVVTARARENLPLIERMLREGHAVGNHSLDHGYRAFFSSEKKLSDWIEKSERELKQILGRDPVGFRPPAGVRTPPLARVLAQKKIPMVLWSDRFFDAVWGWKKAQAIKTLQRLRGGEILLLHDRQKPRHVNEFLETLSYFLKQARESGFQFEALTREMAQTEIF